MQQLARHVVPEAQTAVSGAGQQLPPTAVQHLHSRHAAGVAAQHLKAREGCAALSPSTSKIELPASGSHRIYCRRSHLIILHQHLTVAPTPPAHLERNSRRKPLQQQLGAGQPLIGRRHRVPHPDGAVIRATAARVGERRVSIVCDKGQGGSVSNAADGQATCHSCSLPKLCTTPACQFVNLAFNPALRRAPTGH